MVHANFYTAFQSVPHRRDSFAHTPFEYSFVQGFEFRNILLLRNFFFANLNFHFRLLFVQTLYFFPSSGESGTVSRYLVGSNFFEKKRSIPGQNAWIRVGPISDLNLELLTVMFTIILEVEQPKMGHLDEGLFAWLYEVGMVFGFKKVNTCLR